MHKPQTTRLRISALLATLLVGVAAGRATAENTIVGAVMRSSTFDPNPVALDEFIQTSAGPVADSAFYESGTPGVRGESAFLDARAGFGSVGIRGRAASNFEEIIAINSNVYQTVIATGTATAIFTDVIVSGPGSGGISTKLRIHVGGTLAAGVSGNTDPDTIIGTASVSGGISVNGNFVAVGGRSLESTNTSPGGVFAYGMFAGLGDFGVVTTNAFVVPLNTPFTVKLELTTTLQSRLYYRVEGASAGSSNYYNSIGFATDQPVFDLPAGYTASSVSGGIVNNGYTAVPEPGTAGLLLLAASAALLRRRRQAAN